jgi:hypothetical protein
VVCVTSPVENIVDYESTSGGDKPFDLSSLRVDTILVALPLCLHSIACSFATACRLLGLDGMSSWSEDPMQLPIKDALSITTAGIECQGRQ